MAHNKLEGQWRGAPGGRNQIGSLRPITNIAALEALTATGQPDNARFVFVDCYATPGDKGGGFFEHDATSTALVDGAVTFNSAMGGRWLRQWDGVTFQAAWAGMFPATADISPLMANVPRFCTCWFERGQVYTIATAVPQVSLSNVLWRGVSVGWAVTAAAADFDITALLLNWIYIASGPMQGIGYTNGSSADMTNAGVSPIEGIAILSKLSGNAGVGLALGEPASSTYGIARATTSHATGKYHFEFTPGDAAGSFVGFADAGFDLNGILGVSPNSIVLGPDGGIHVNSYGLTATIDPPSSGHVYALEIDFGAQLLWGCNTFTNPTQWNASGTANPATGTGGVSFAALPAATQYFAAVEAATVNACSINFGATTFAKAVSSGFSAYGVGTTLNPADQVRLTFSNGNLTVTNNTVGYPFDSTYSENYFVRPKNFSVGGFYVNVGYTNATHTFLTGLDSVVMKAGVIGLYHNNGLDSGENLTYPNCNFNQLRADGFEFFNAQSTTLVGCSFTYSVRVGYVSNNETSIVSGYFELASTNNFGNLLTANEVIAVDGGTVLNLDGSTKMLYLPQSAVDIIAFDAGSGGYGQAYFNGTQMYNRPGLNPVRMPVQFFISSPGKNVFGYTKGFNGDNFSYALSPNQLLQPDYNFASNGLTFYPGSTNATVQGSVVHGTQTHAVALASVNGSSTLQASTWDVNPGELIFFDFFDKVAAGGPGFTSVGGTVTFLTGDGIQVSTALFTRAAGVVGFTPGGAELSPNWGSGGAHDWTQEYMVFRVPPGASKMTSVVTVTSTATGSTYYISEFTVRSNAR